MTDYFSYSAKETPYALFPLGGIGAGSVSIGSDGRLKDWEIFNRPAKGGENGVTHFAVRAERDGEVLDTRVLHGPFGGNRSGETQGPRFWQMGFGANRNQMTGFPSFSESVLSGPYPIANLEFKDHRFPGTVSMQALSPFIPLDDRASSMPLAMFEFEITNNQDHDMDYSLIGCLGLDIEKPEAIAQSNGTTHFIGGKSKVERDHYKYAELCLLTDAKTASYQRHSYRGNWFDTLEVYWQDISAPGKLTDRYYEQDRAGAQAGGIAAVTHSVLASHITLKPGETRRVKFALSWFVPSMAKYWPSNHRTTCCSSEEVPNNWKNYYSTQWQSAEQVALEAMERWDEFKQGTTALRDILAQTTAPLAIRDAVSATMSVLKTPTTLRMEDGTFYGFEGCHMDSGCCEGSCTHVWGYQQVLPFLFPSLERSMRDADFDFNLDPETGGMAFRTMLPMGAARSLDIPCADGQFGNIMKTYRDWKLCGDDEWLRSLWPKVVAALEFAWHPNNTDKWDPERSGVLTGRQHHTLDMELYGASSWLTGLYLGALVSAAEMAEALGESERAAEYRAIFAKGKTWVADNLFNGEYFIQDLDLNDRGVLEQFSDSTQISYVDGDIFDLYWSEEHKEIKYQIGHGCEIDQVLAQWHANLYGLGEDIFKQDQFESTVNAIYKYNYYDCLGELANPCRIFGMDDEAGTIMCAFPKDQPRPAIPVVYTQETMHGFEYAAGCQLLMIGKLKEGTQVFKAVRDRYRGHNRNPWNEIECGSNYARSMASYSAVLTLSGFSFDATDKSMGFKPVLQDDGVFRSLWSNGLAWGQVCISEGKIEISVKGGSLELVRLNLGELSFHAAELGTDGAESALFKEGETLKVEHAGISVGSKQQLNLLEIEHCGLGEARELETIS